MKRALGELNNVFQDEFNKISSQQSTNVRFFLSHNCIKRTRLKNKGPKHTYLAMSWNVWVGCCHDVKNMYSAIFDVMKNLISHVCKTRKFVMAILHGKQGLLCDKLLLLLLLLLLWHSSPYLITRTDSHRRTQLNIVCSCFLLVNGDVL